MTHSTDVSGRAEIVVATIDLDAELAFFTETAGFRIESVFPADGPRVAVVSGYGVRLRLDTEAEAAPATLRLEAEHVYPGEWRTLVAPNGTVIEIVPAKTLLELPALCPQTVVTRIEGTDGFAPGRAGMLYRDLIPGRLGGRFIGSHIRIPNGGPVPDYVHFHHIRFQMIYCYRGWVRVVYEYQGEPFVMHPGDCVLQPPRIRHRVLECSDNLEVIELGSPADHITEVDHSLELPAACRGAQRDFSGQRFVWHRSAAAEWAAVEDTGFERQLLGIEEATNGLARVRTLRAQPSSSLGEQRHQHELLFHFVLSGELTLHLNGSESCQLSAGDTFVIPAGRVFRYVADQPMELLEVCVPG